MHSEKPLNQFANRRGSFAVLVPGAVIAALVSSCNSGHSVSFHFTTYTSATILDETAEGPLDKPVEKYAPLLARSNELVSLLKEGELKQIHQDAFGWALRHSVSEADLDRTYGDLVDQFGPVVSFKPQQWKFLVGEENGRPLVTCVKAVMHAKGRVEYSFTFADETTTRLLGLHFKDPKAKSAMWRFGF